jgi:hypothetical protein
MGLVGLFYLSYSFLHSPRARPCWPNSNSDTGGEFSGSATMPATALVREVESARESRPAELFAREQAVDLEFATSVSRRVAL